MALFILARKIGLRGSQHRAQEDAHDKAAGPDDRSCDDRHRYHGIGSLVVVPGEPDEQVTTEATEESDDGCAVPGVSAHVSKTLVSQRTALLTRCHPTEERATA